MFIFQESTLKRALLMKPIRLQAVTEKHDLRKKSSLPMACLCLLRTKPSVDMTRSAGVDVAYRENTPIRRGYSEEKYLSAVTKWTVTGRRKKMTFGWELFGV